MISPTYKVLFVSSEVFPFIKTGGLADVSAGLPIALHKLGQDVKVLMPAYKVAMENASRLKIKLKKIPGFSGHILEGQIPNSNVSVWFLVVPELYYRDGGPYSAPNGIDWPDNAQRYATLADVAVMLCQDKFSFGWKPDLVHCNDWQTGLIPAKLSQLDHRPATVFTIHNMAYLGLFAPRTFRDLNLPDSWKNWDKLDFHNQLCFMKGGLVFADQINTVSPTYAEQIRTAEFGYGMEGLLQYRSDRLCGILNGIDYDKWDPQNDNLLHENYNSDTLDAKAKNKQYLQQISNLPEDSSAFVIGMIGRMVEQKGFDLLLTILPEILKNNIQIVVLGSGDPQLENQLIVQAGKYSSQFKVTIGYNEELAHQIEAGVDSFLMPSRFEPCGLNQFYSLRYGTVPIVHHTGGLADSVVDVKEAEIDNGSATGFKFYSPDTAALLAAIQNAYALFQSKTSWLKLMKNGMDKDFSWNVAAQHYIALYQKSIESQDSKNRENAV